MWFRSLAVTPRSVSKDIERASSDRVDRTLDALDGRFGSFDVLDEEWPVETEWYEHTVRRHEEGTVGGAGTWTVRPKDDAVLMVRERPGGPWSEPAGGQEPAESLVETAIRETNEETGVAVTVDDVGFAQHVQIRDDAESDRPPIHRLVLVFDATPRDPDVTPTAPAGDSVAEARWITERPQALLYDALGRLPFPDER